MEQYFEFYKAMHIISVIAWMAGMLYLPRLFVYHTQTSVGSELDETFKLMESRLLRYIMNPAMISTYIFGFLMSYVYGIYALGPWFHIKMLAVLALSGAHGFFAVCRKKFERGENKFGGNFYRLVNEVPTILMIIAIFTVIFKPFE
jgi:putative membrane protein